MNTQVLTWQQCIEKCLYATQSREYDCKIDVFIDERTQWKAYSASISKQDILLYCDKGTATFLIDIYGDSPVATLYDWTKE
jgi:hypothetical protein